MRRLLRWLLRGFTVVSLLLFAATCAIWARSYWVSDLIICEEPGEAPFIVHDAYTVRGSLVIVQDVEGIRFVNGVEDDGPPPTARRWSWEHDAVERHYVPAASGLWNAMGFYYIEGDAHGVEWTVPLWPILGLSALPPALYVIAILRCRRRLVAGFCIQCGYDLRTTPARCPECGAIPAMASFRP